MSAAVALDLGRHLLALALISVAFSLAQCALLLALGWKPGEPVD